MDKLKLLLLLVVFGSVVHTYGQSTGTIRLLVDPGHNFKFVVDKKFQMEQREVTLSEGLHDLSIWAPQRMVVDTPVFVVADRTTDLVVRLPYSADYKAFLTKRSSYLTKKRWVTAAPVLVIGTGLIWTTVGYSKYAKAKNDLDADREAYRINASPADINDLKDVVIPEHNEALKTARRSMYVGGGISLVGACATYYIRRMTAKWERPIFDDKEKVKFEGLTWMPAGNGGIFMAGLVINIGQ